MFKGLGSRVVGLVTSPREADAWVDRYYTRSPTYCFLRCWGEHRFTLSNNLSKSFFFRRDELSSLLSSCDYILAMLPATPSTDGLLGG